MAKGGLRTVQKQFDDQQNVIEFIVYETVPLFVENLPEYDVLVFTSPSSVESFAAHHIFLTDKRYIAIGKSTHNTLSHFGAKHAELSEGFTDKDLMKAVINNSI